MKKNNEVKLIVAIVHDKIAKCMRTIAVGETEQAIVSNLVFGGIGNRFPYRDLEIRKVGYVDYEGKRIESLNHYEVIPWDIYAAPVSERENLETLGEDVVKAYDEVKKEKLEKEEKEKVDGDGKTENDNKKE